MNFYLYSGAMEWNKSMELAIHFHFWTTMPYVLQTESEDGR